MKAVWQNREHEDLTFTKLPDDGKTCIRLRNKAGEHKLSLLPCGIDEAGRVTSVDLATPDGDVLYCGLPNCLVDLLIQHLGTEKIDEVV